MDLPIRTCLRAIFLPLACALVVASCSQQTSKAASTAAPLATAVPTANPDELAGIVSRFYRDVGSTQKGAISDLVKILSPGFMKRQHDNWVRDYGYIANPRVSIDAVSGHTVSYTVDYDYLSSDGGRISWTRTGIWLFAHGALGWLLDRDDWKSIHITAWTLKDGTRYAATDRVYPDGRHTFETPWGTEEFVATATGWRMDLMATPTPNPQSPVGLAPSQYQPPARPTYIAPPYVPPAAGTDCEDVSVTDVFSDGEILELDDGRHLRVADYDTSTSSVWVAPFDGLICDGGDKFINKDDNESVDLQP